MEILKVENIGFDDVKYLNEILLDDNGYVRVHPAEVYDNIPNLHLRIWLHFQGRYSLPTLELIQFLENEIGLLKNETIEIGAGAGDLGHALGIKMTDSFIQLQPDVRLHYELMHQPLVPYGQDVEKLEAIEAIIKYKPKIVVGSWITQLYKEGDVDGSIYGVDEERLLDLVDKYILIGSKKAHGSKRILVREHKEYDFAHLVGRARSDAGNENIIFVWSK
jgi:hypothetical protein